LTHPLCAILKQFLATYFIKKNGGLNLEFSE